MVNWWWCSVCGWDIVVYCSVDSQSKCQLKWPKPFNNTQVAAAASPFAFKYKIISMRILLLSYEQFKLCHLLEKKLYFDVKRPKERTHFKSIENYINNSIQMKLMKSLSVKTFYYVLGAFLIMCNMWNLVKAFRFIDFLLTKI